MLRNRDAAHDRLTQGLPALVWQRRIADTLTPVGAACALMEDGRGDFLLESVEGGEIRGRYSLMGLDPDLVFLDEPTSGLDPIGAAAFDDLVMKLRETLGLTVYMVTHDLDSLHSICDRVAVLGEKRVLTAGPIEELRRFDNDWVQDYFNGVRALRRV